MMGNSVQKLNYSDAERKTSMGRDWHPTCLKCYECGRVLSPGQHAEHKGNPYCQTPCYKALFGPSLLGYGSNVASPANFARKDAAAEFGHDYDDDVQKREIYSHSRASAARKQNQRRSAPASIIDHFSAPSLEEGTQKRDFANDSREGKLYSDVASSSSSSSSLRPEASTLRSVSVDSVPSAGGGVTGSHTVSVVRARSFESAKDSRLKPTVGESEKARSGSLRVNALSRNSGSTYIYVDGSNGDSVDNPSVIPSEAQRVPVTNAVNHVNGCDLSSRRISGGVDLCSELPDILEKVKLFNSHYEGKVHHQMILDQLPNGDVSVLGPLRIYWGLSRPIQLRQCDNVPAPPIAKWRHSLCANINDGPSHNNTASQTLQRQDSPKFYSPHRPLRGMDDSILMSPVSADDVVLRRKVRKFNTVAYRNDAPTKWKRASINGHIFNYDTSVFIPVLGSSTSVIADSTMTSPVVIKTLLEKFKVENSPKEYVLSVVTEKGDQTNENVLGDGDYPLLERLLLGADESNAKIFLKEGVIEPEVTVPDTVKLPIMEEEEEEEMLPAEVEQLMILPIAVLKGIMIKFEKDEAREVKLLKMKFDRVKHKIRQRLEELQSA